MKKRAISLLLAVLMLAASFQITAFAADMAFTDVEKSDWFYSDVKIAFESGLINGRTAVTFAPNENLKYSEAVKLAAAMNQLYRNGKVTLENGEPMWYSSYVTYCQGAGIISKDYKWEEAATRAGYMEIFANALPAEALEPINSVEDGSIPDVPMTHPQAKAIYKLYRAGILEGSSDYVDGVLTEHLCKPSDNIRRSEVAAILTRMMNQDQRKTFSLGETEELLVTIPDTLSTTGGKDVAVEASISGGKAPYKCQWEYSTDGKEWKKGSAGTGVISYTYTTATSPKSQYVRLSITDANEKTAESNICTISISAGLKITAQPQDIAVSEGKDAVFSVAVSGGKEPYTYQWHLISQTDKDEIITDYTGLFSGAKTDTFTRISCQTAMDNGVSYYCVITDAAGAEVSSDKALLTVKSSLSAAVNQTECYLSSFDEKFELTATPSGGTKPYTYQWYWGSTEDKLYDMSTYWSGDSTSSSLAAKPDPRYNTQYMYCKITDAAGNTADTPIVTITVKETEQLAAEATAKSVMRIGQGSYTLFSVKASGGTEPYTYQWQVYIQLSGSSRPRWADLTGKTSATMTLSASDAVANTPYRCKVTDAEGETVSSNTVKPKVYQMGQ